MALSDDGAAPGTDPAGNARLTDRRVSVAAHTAARQVSAQLARATEVTGHLRASRTGNAFVTLRRRQHRLGPAEQSAIGHRQRSGTATRPVRSRDTEVPGCLAPNKAPTACAPNALPSVGASPGAGAHGGPEKANTGQKFGGTHGAQEGTERLPYIVHPCPGLTLNPCISSL